MPADLPRLAELLEKLEAQWQRHGAGIADALAPGLPQDQLDELMAPLGLTLPVELRAWWGWHNGTTADPNDSYTRNIGPGYDYISLEEAIVHYRQARALWPAPVDRDPEQYWHQTWLPVLTLASHGQGIYVDCVVPVGEPTPLYLRSREWDDYLRPRTASFTEFIAACVDALRDDVYFWVDGGWDFDRSRFPYLPGSALLSPKLKGAQGSRQAVSRGAAERLALLGRRAGDLRADYWGALTGGYRGQPPTALSATAPADIHQPASDRWDYPGDDTVPPI